MPTITVKPDPPKQATARCELIFSDVQWGP